MVVHSTTVSSNAYYLLINFANLSSLGYQYLENSRYRYSSNQTKYLEDVNCSCTYIAILHTLLTKKNNLEKRSSFGEDF